MRLSGQGVKRQVGAAMTPAGAATVTPIITAATEGPAPASPPGPRSHECTPPLLRQPEISGLCAASDQEGQGMAKVAVGRFSSLGQLDRGRPGALCRAFTGALPRLHCAGAGESEKCGKS